MSELLRQWVIYAPTTRDFPGLWPVRQWVIRSGGETVAHHVACLCSSLAEARRQIPPGLFRLPRYPDDDPVIVEVWF